MARAALILVVVSGVCAWTSAQSVPTAAEQARLFQQNRDLLQTLLSDGLAIGEHGESPLTRIAAVRQAARTLSRALDSACQRDEPDRVAELGDHLSEMLMEGLAPALESARKVYPVGSPGYAEFEKLDAASVEDVKAAVRLIPVTGKLGTQPHVRAARGRLNAVVLKVTP